MTEVKKFKKPNKKLAIKILAVIVGVCTGIEATLLGEKIVDYAQYNNYLEEQKDIENQINLFKDLVCLSQSYENYNFEEEFASFNYNVDNSKLKEAFFRQSSIASYLFFNLYNSKYMTNTDNFNINSIKSERVIKDILKEFDKITALEKSQRELFTIKLKEEFPILSGLLPPMNQDEFINYYEDLTYLIDKAGDGKKINYDDSFVHTNKVK